MFSTLRLHGFLVVALVFLGSGLNAQSLELNEVSEASLGFSYPITVQRALEIASENGVELVSIESSFEFGGIPIHDSHPVSRKDDAAQLEARYLEARRTSVQDVLNTLASDELQNQDGYEELRAAFESDSVQSLSGQIDVIRSIVRGTMERLQSLAGNSEVETVEFSDGSHAEANTALPEALAPLPSGALGTWWPNRGSSHADKSGSTKRYTIQYMKWDNTPPFTDGLTYEHDLFLYNYDRKTYLASAHSSWPTCIPVTTYWSTTWPSTARPYLDSRLNAHGTGCPIDELSYTIGAAAAHKLAAGVMYYTYIQTSNGNSTTDKFKLQGQLGYRYPTNCYTTFCSYRHSGTTLVPSWNTAVPGAKTWVK